MTIREVTRVGPIGALAVLLQALTSTTWGLLTPELA